MVGKMKEWAGYNRCPSYKPVCNHTEWGNRKPQQDELGMCEAYFFQDIYICEGSPYCDGYGWVAMSTEKLKQLLIMMKGEVGTKQ